MARSKVPHKIILALLCDTVLHSHSMKAKKSTTAKVKSNADSKQLIHMRIERSILREIDRYAKSTKVTRSVVARDILRAWVDKKAKPNA
jgi:hypothetical protein